MDQLSLKKYSKYFFIGCFVLIMIISVILIRSFLISILGAIILAYIFYPLYKKLLRKIRNKTLCSLIVTIIVLVVLIVPVIFATNAIINESVSLFYKINNIDSSDINKYIGPYFGENIDIGAYIKNMLNNLSVYIMQQTEKFIWSIPEKFISLFVMFFIIFYSLKDGKSFIKLIGKEIPLREKHKKNLSKKFNSVIYATLYGIIVTSIVAGILGALGFYIFKLGPPILWGLIMAILSMLPVVGASLVWLPVGIYAIVTGNVFAGIGFMIYNWIAVSSMENIVRPKIIGVKGKVHPVFVLLGVLGGLKVFGLIGIIIGPLILSILTLFFEIYISEKHETKGKGY